MPTYSSQVGQDRIVNEVLFCGMRDGVFVDVGAHDGVSFSNTLMFEQDLGWTGLCIEPNPPIFEKLAANRKATCLNLAIAETGGTLPFIKVDGYAEMLSGLADSMDPRHRQRIEQEVAEKSGAIATIQVATRPLSTIFREHKIAEIHYLSVDTEGTEAEVLASIDFDAVMIHLITVEANYNEPRDEIDAMLSRRFDLVGQQDQDLYFINRRSPFVSKAPALRGALSLPYKPYRVRQFRRMAGRVLRSFYPKFRS